MEPKMKIKLRLHLVKSPSQYQMESPPVITTPKVGDEMNHSRSGNGPEQDHYNVTPLVSVILLNYNGENILAKCLSSVLQTDYTPFEVIVVDNGSRDGSLDTISRFQTIDKRVKLVRNSSNLGYSLGNNVGASHAKGEYLLFLNNDITVEPNWLRELVKVVGRSSAIAAAQPKMLMMDEPTIIHSTGGYLTPYGTIYNRETLSSDRSSLASQSEVLVATGAALLVRREIFFKVGKFDSRFFIYNEELDLCWRIWLSGYTVVFVPAAVVYHALGWTNRGLRAYNSFMFYYGHRNYINTLFKNLTLRHFFRYAIPYTLLFLGYTVHSSLRVRNAWYYVIRAWSWNIVNFRSTYSKRLFTQNMIRKVADDVILRRLTKRIGLIELVQMKAFAGPQKLSRVLRPR
jgi:GT2 family glycosyltransferase